MGIIPLPNHRGGSEVTAIYPDGYVDELSVWFQELLMIGWFWGLCKGNMLHDEVFFHLREWMIEPTHILTQGAWANIAISHFFYQITKVIHRWCHWGWANVLLSHGHLHWFTKRFWFPYNSQDIQGRIFSWPKKATSNCQPIPVVVPIP